MLQYQRGPPPQSTSSSASSGARITTRHTSPPRGSGIDKYRHNDVSRRISRQRSVDNHSSEGQVKVTRSSRHSPPEDPRLKNRPPEPPEPSVSSVVPVKKKKKDKEVY